jgi:hypothetical protein
MPAPYRPDLGRGLEQHRAEALLAESNSGGEAGDAAADDGDG